MLNTRKGFTVIELLIVVIIVGILAAIVVPMLTDSLEKAKGSDAKSGLTYIYRAEIDYSGLRGGTFTDDIAELTDVTLTTRYWDFNITMPTSRSFLATATRKDGRQKNQTITVDQTATFSGNWEFL